MGRSAESNRALSCCLLFAIAVGAGFIALNLPVRLVQVGVPETTSSLPINMGSATSSYSSLETSGWPLVYQFRLVEYRDPKTKPTMELGQSASLPVPSNDSDLSFSWPYLLVNIAVAILSMALVAWVTWARHVHLHRSNDANRIRRRYDFATALTCLALPLFTYGLLYAKANRHIRLANELNSKGRISLTANVPAWMSERLPTSFCHVFLRVRNAHLIAPTQDVLEQLQQLETLREVQIYATNIDVADLDFIDTASTLTNLALTNCRLSSAAFERIAGHQSLRKLSLRGCPLNSLDTHALDRLPHLESLDLSRTGVDLSKVNQPGLAKRVKRLRLSRPKAGQSDSLVIDGWKKLRSLHLHRSQNVANDSTFNVNIRNCPELKELHLDRWQKHSLIAENLPKFSRIHEPFPDLTLDNNVPDIPAMSRWQKLELTNVPMIRSLEFQAEDFESLKLRNVPRLESVSIGNFLGDLFEPIAGNSEQLFEVDNWLEEISKTPSIVRVHLNEIKLGERAIELVSQLPFLKDFDCRGTNLVNDDLEPLLRRESLETLNLGRCSVDQKRFNQLIGLPNLKSLTADFSTVEEFVAEGHPNVEALRSAPFERLRSLTLRKLPRLNSSIVIQNQIERLHVLNVPLLQELIVECPWPEDSTIEGVNHLIRFAAGGSNLDDSLLEILLRCEDLDQLTMAYPNLSPQDLQQIGKIASLTMLELPGCPITDSIVAAWSPLSRLRRVCFDDTKIGPKTIRWLSTLESLRSLSLNRVDLRGQTGAELLNLRQLNELSLAEAQIDPATIVEMLEKCETELLNLSHLKITEPIFDGIKKSKSLKYCVLNECGLTVAQVHDLLASAPNLHIEISSLDTEDIQRDADPTQPRRFKQAIIEPAGFKLARADWRTLKKRIHGLPDPGSPPRYFGRHRSRVPTRVTHPDQITRKASNFLSSRPFDTDRFRGRAVPQQTSTN